MAEAFEDIAASLAVSSKYRHLAPDALKRTAIWALERHKKPADALKAAKRKLHQGFGAYLDPGALSAVHHLLDEVDEDTDLGALSERILALHRSSAERLPHQETFYRAIWAETGLPEHLLDVGAGLNPFALASMGLPKETRYTALEIDSRLVDAVNRYFVLIGQHGEAMWTDVLSGIDPAGADLALVLKTLPCLEQQESGASLGLLTALGSVATLVVSYPVRSLGGREKGMRSTYREQITTLSAQTGRTMTELAIEDELFVVLRHVAM